MGTLTELEQNVLKAKQEEGLTVIEILNKYHITRFNYNKMIAKFKMLNLYDEKAIIKAKNKRQKASASKEDLTETEKQYRQKSIEFLAVNYFDYNKTKKFNPLLVKRIKELNIISSYETIYLTMQGYKKNLDYYTQNKKFDNDNSKLNYILAVIKNHLDEYEQVLTNQKQQENKNTKINIQDKYNIENLNVKQKQTTNNKFDFSVFD